jgi:FixJ family two-component response regulator
MRSSSSSSSTPRIEEPLKARRLSDHLSTTIQRQKSRNQQRHNTYAQLKHLAQRRLNVIAELVTLDEQYDATLAKLLLPGNN